MVFLFVCFFIWGFCFGLFFPSCVYECKCMFLLGQEHENFTVKYLALSEVNLCHMINSCDYSYNCNKPKCVTVFLLCFYTL